MANKTKRPRTDGHQERSQAVRKGSDSRPRRKPSKAEGQKRRPASDEPVRRKKRPADQAPGKKSQSSGKSTGRRKDDERRRPHPTEKDIRSKKKARRGSWSTGKKVAVILAGVLVLLITAAIGVLASKYSKIDKVELDTDKLSLAQDIGHDETGYLNVALFGLDTRDEDPEMGSRSDTIMIASLNRETKEVKLCSVFRDTLLQQDDGTYNKANSAYSFGGAEDAIAMLNKNLDMDIQHYVTVDFAALVDVIDALGGIEIDVQEDEIDYLNGYACEIIENTGVDTWAVVEPGLQNLTGVQATAYARIRYTSGDDFRRAERQRTVLQKVAEKAQGANLATLNKIIDKVFPKVETNFTLTEMLAYAKDVKNYKIGESTGFPFEKATMVFGNAGDSVIPVTLQSNTVEMHKFFFGEDGYTPSSKLITISDEISYLSGSGSAGTSGNNGYDNGTNNNSYNNGYNDGGYTDSSGYSNPTPSYTPQDNTNSDTTGNNGNTGNTGGNSDPSYGGSESGTDYNNQNPDNNITNEDY